MTADLYPTTFSEWATLITVMAPVILWAATSAGSAWVYYRKQQEQEWRRLFDLIKVLNNKDHEFGGWAQIAAIDEMMTLRLPRSTIVRVAREAKFFWEMGIQGGGRTANLYRLAELLDDPKDCLTSAYRGRRE